MFQYIALEGNAYFWFGANDTNGSGDDGASAAFDVRLAGATDSAAPVYSGTPSLLSHANYPAGCYEIAIPATATNGFAANQVYAVFCTLAVDSQNPTGFVGAFRTGPVIANTIQISGTAQTARDIGASVLLSSGTGTGQIKLTNGYPGVNWNDIVNPTSTVNLSGTSIDTVNDAMEANDVAAAVLQALLGDHDDVSGSVGEAIALLVTILNAARSEPTGVPAHTATLPQKIDRLFAALINGIQQSASKKQFLNSSGTAVWEKDVSDNGTTYSESAGNAP